jgi:dedicator of cytokinesis protein 6/7/8
MPSSSLAEYLLIVFVQNSFFNFGRTTRLRVMLTITLSELMSDVQVAQMRPDGSMEESGEARRLRKSLEEVADESNSVINLLDCGLPPTALNVIQEGSAENKWSWPEVKQLSQCLILALDAGLDHALLVSIFASYFVS